MTQRNFIVLAGGSEFISFEEHTRGYYLRFRAPSGETLDMPVEEDQFEMVAHFYARNLSEPVPGQQAAPSPEWPVPEQPDPDDDDGRDDNIPDEDEPGIVRLARARGGPTSSPFSDPSDEL